MQMGSKCKQRELNPNLVEPKVSYHVKSPIVQKVKLFGKGPNDVYQNYPIVTRKQAWPGDCLVPPNRGPILGPPDKYSWYT